MGTTATVLSGDKVDATRVTPARKWLPVIRVAAPLVVGTLILLLPHPAALSVNAWRYFALFAAVVVGIIAEPLPPAVVGLAGVCVAAAAGLVRSSAAQSAGWALGGFGNLTVWLIAAAYMFGLAYSKTGLGKRIALLLIRVMGKRTLGLGYAVALSDLALAPFMPSNTARSGGTIFPVLSNIPPLYASHPNDPSARKLGAYLMYTAMAMTFITSSMFLTACAPNLLAIEIIKQALGVKISWFDWFKGFVPVGLGLFVLTPILLYKVYPPEIKEAPDAPQWAAEELRKLGGITAKEIKLLVLAIAALGTWMGAGKFIEPGLAAVLIVVLMVALGVVTWKEVLENTQGWNVFVWFATMVTLAGGLVETGFVRWLASSVAKLVSGAGAIAALLLLVGAFCLLHYLFASGTAHVAALLPVFLPVAAAAAPVFSAKTCGLMFAYTIGLMSLIAPYAGGPAPIYASCGYIRPRHFWLLGLFMGLLFFAVTATAALAWLLFIGN